MAGWTDKRAPEASGVWTWPGEAIEITASSDVLTSGASKRGDEQLPAKHPLVSCVAMIALVLRPPLPVHLGGGRALAPAVVMFVSLDHSSQFDLSRACFSSPRRGPSGQARPII